MRLAQTLLPHWAVSKVLGIDLGTTNSCMAIMEGGEPVVVPNSEGGRTTPSVVAFAKNGERVVGQAAKRQAVTNPQNTIFSAKRLIGRKHHEVEEESKHLPFSIVEGKNGDAWIECEADGKTEKFAPERISSMILAKLKADAEAYLGEDIKEAVITVPAYFNDAQRQATKDAGTIAGLEVKRIINEPTAASLAYGLDRKSDETIAVFDLGGGTYDISILEIGDGVFEVKATNGDTHLGGDDWDQAIVNWAADEFQKAEGIDIRNDRQALQRIREASEKAKIELSSVMQTEINLPFVTADAAGPKHLQLTLARSTFDQLTDHLLDRLREPVENALKDAGTPAADVDQVVLVGGSSRMPMVQSLVERLLGKPPHRGVNPDEVVAIGAAIQGGVLGGEVKDILLLDVTPLTLGLETLGAVMTALIERNTTVPVTKSQIFSTAADHQTAVDIHVLQGERTMAADNMSLGRFRLEGIPSAPRGLPQIDVTFDIDANGILNVTAQDKATSKQQKITITASTNLDQQEIDRMVNEALQHDADDRQRADIVDARNQADSVIYAAEKAMSELGDKLTNDNRATIDKQIKDLREAAQSEELPRIREFTQQLEQAVHALAQQAAASAQADDQSHSGSNEADSSSDDEDVVEGEFTEA